MSISAGGLDRRITLQRAVEAPDAFNESVPAWGPLATVWASRQDVSDGERTRAAQAGAVITTRFRVRWARAWADLTPKDRLVELRPPLADLVYDIVAVKEIGRRDGLEITAAAQPDKV